MKSFQRVFAVALLLAAAGVLVSQPAPPERVGPRPDGGFLLNSGWVLKPAGRQIPLSTLPMSSAISPDSKYVVVLQGGYLPPSISLHDAATMKELDRITLPDAWLGLAFAPAGNVFYVGGGSRACVYELGIKPEGKLERRRELTFVPAEQRKPTDFVGDVAVSPDGRMVYAAALYKDLILVFNPQSGMLVEQWKTGRRPYKILFHPEGKSFFVTGWADGALHRHESATGEELGKVLVGLEPMDMVWQRRKVEAEPGEQEQPWKDRIFVAVSGTNQVSVLGVGDEGKLSKIETIQVGLYPNQPAGMTPSALALSPDGGTLSVVCANANSVALADVSGKVSDVLGFVPVGWYPTSARFLPDWSLLVLNGRGERSFPNPDGPNPTKRRAIEHEGIVAVQYVAAIQTGSASLIPRPNRQELEEYTKRVIASSPYRPEDESPKVPEGNPVVRPDAIQHVIYVVKENRTYDQVLGDLRIGNGDPSLALFTEESSPNHHKLAREFVLLDNFYVNADVSADGHNWSSSAIAPAYVERLWPNSYAKRRNVYDYEGQERAAQAPAGYLWSNALQKGLTVRNYGWWVSNITPAPASGKQISAVRDPSLAPHTNLDYRGFDLQYKDIDRIQVFLKDLAEFERSGKMPSLVTLRLGNDHTSGTAPGRIAPLSAMADNDAALGMLVEAVSRSSFWATTAIFVLEDDAQNGPDHVDSHRSPAFILSPYTRGRGIDSSMYNTVSVLRTIEVILGLRPMTMHDAGARVMWSAFKPEPDLRPYAAEKPRIPLDTLNKQDSPMAMRAKQMDLDEADMIDDEELNEILWRAIRHTEPPAPVRSIWGR